jgi:hypothetical protein
MTNYGFGSGSESGAPTDEQASWLDSLKHPGCLAWALALLLVFGVVVTVFVITGDDEPPTTAGPSAASAGPATSAPAARCEDATAALRDFARGQAGGREEFVVEAITGACWDASGELRADLDVPADIEARSAPMRWLCGTLSDFVAGSGRPWEGFTAKSSSRLSPGRTLLVGSEPDAACTR